MKRILLVIFSLLLMITNLFSHGTKFKIIPPPSVSIQTTFDDDKPMAHNDVLIFSPGSTKSSGKTKTDSNGIFQFTPDKPGNWTFQVRDKGGHGMRINFEVNESLQIIENPESSQISHVQKIIMALCVLWGFLGTALFFARKK